MSFHVVILTHANRSCQAPAIVEQEKVLGKTKSGRVTKGPAKTAAPAKKAAPKKVNAKKTTTPKKKAEAAAAT